MIRAMDSQQKIKPSNVVTINKHAIVF